MKRKHPKTDGGMEMVLSFPSSMAGSGRVGQKVRGWDHRFPACGQRNGDSTRIVGDNERGMTYWQCFSLHCYPLLIVEPGHFFLMFDASFPKSYDLWLKGLVLDDSAAENDVISGIVYNVVPPVG